LHSDTLETALEPFFDDGLITDILYQVKSGKEATVFCCRGGANFDYQVVAAKVYKARDFRGFRNDAIYQEGRVILDKRAARAVAKRTGFGGQVRSAMWSGHEWGTLRTLRAAGADVPTPLAQSAGAILMEFIGDAEAAAPSLKSVDLSRKAAEAACARLLDNIQLWLAYDIVHGDLSPFNVLYHADRPVVIDFPQAVDPRVNGNAFTLLHRDIENLTRHFAKFGIQHDAFALAERYYSVWERP
jgi:RIO kinase 1